MNFDVVIVRHSGEIGIKGKQTRKWMETILTNNIRKKLEKAELNVKEIIQEKGRIYIYGQNLKTISEAVSNVFGVISTSRAIIVDSDIDKISDVARKVAEEILEAGDSFRITTRRIGTHPFTSEDVAIKAGSAILDRTSEKGVCVNLSNPNKQIFVEIRHDKAYVYSEIINAIGGMPIGTQGKIACIIACDDLDWIASFLMMKRGCTPVLIIFNTSPLSNNKDYVVEKCPPLSVLKDFSPSKISIFRVPFATTLEELKQSVSQDLQYVLCKKIQLFIAKHLCEKFDIKAVVTGDLLDHPEIAKIYNSIDTSIKLPIYRPLISFDEEQLNKYKSLLSARIDVSCHNLCKTTSKMYKNQFFEKLPLEEIVNRAIVKIKHTIT